jgi:hypothetical protein
VSDAAILASVVRWLERAVIGLNLCPFAKSVHVKGQIHYAVYRAESAVDTDANLEADLLLALRTQLHDLAAASPLERDTTLMVVPEGYADFLGFQALVARADKVLRKAGLEGVLQIAHFHPDFEFAGAAPGDITNFTNRAPYPILHLLREDSIARAVEAIPDADSIYEKNMETLTRLGESGWRALDIGPALCEPKDDAV